MSDVREDASQCESLAVSGAMSAEELAGLPVPEAFIVSRCHLVTRQVTDALEEMNFGDAGNNHSALYVLYIFIALSGCHSSNYLNLLIGLLRVQAA